MPQHIVSIEVPEMEIDDGVEEAVEESEEEYESEDEDTQEHMYCQTQFITQEKAQEIETSLMGETFIENNYFYQYKETEEGKFHTGILDEQQQKDFKEFMKWYNNLFA